MTHNTTVGTIRKVARRLLVWSRRARSSLAPRQPMSLVSRVHSNAALPRYRQCNTDLAWCGSFFFNKDKSPSCPCNDVPLLSTAAALTDAVLQPITTETRCTTFNAIAHKWACYPPLLLLTILHCRYDHEISMDETMMGVNLLRRWLLRAAEGIQSPCG